MFILNRSQWNCLSKLMCLASAMLIAAGLLYAIYRWSFLRHSVATEAIVADLIAREFEDGETLYAPVYVFSDRAGNKVRVTSTTYSTPSALKIGDSIPVLYRPRNPRQAIQDRFFSKWGFAAITSGLGCFYLIVFGFIAFLTRETVMRNSASPPEEALQAKDWTRN